MLCVLFVWFCACVCVCVHVRACICARVYQCSRLLHPLPLIHASLLMVESLTLLRPQAVCGCECVCVFFSPRLPLQECLSITFIHIYSVCMCAHVFSFSSGCSKYWSPYGQWAKLTLLQYTALSHPPINPSSHSTNDLLWSRRRPDALAHLSSH